MTSIVLLVQIAAFIAEPVMGAGGVMPPPATYWDKVVFWLILIVLIFRHLLKFSRDNSDSPHF